MDKRIIEIMDLVYRINEKGGKYNLYLTERSLDVKDENSRGILKDRCPAALYITNEWKETFEETINLMIEILKTKLEELI